METSRLTQLRKTLSEKKTDLQRLYRFNFRSTKLLLFNADLYIISISHPQYQFGNMGDYQGYISSVTKPNEMNIVFLEDQQHTINFILDLWESLKLNKRTGIFYPKAVYSDQALLVYEGEYPIFSAAPPASLVSKDNTSSGVDSANTSDIKIPPIYYLSDIYPINRESITLSYSSNEIQTVSVTFNVDDIKLQTGLATLAQQVANPIASNTKNKGL